MAHKYPMLLLDNTSMLNVIGDGEYSSHKMKLEETRALLEDLEAEDIRICFDNNYIVNIIFPWLGIKSREFEYKQPRRMHVGQDAIVFKLHVTPSDSQPEVEIEDGIEAKKIQNVFVYCQYLTRVK